MIYYIYNSLTDTHFLNILRTLGESNYYPSHALTIFAFDASHTAEAQKFMSESSTYKQTHNGGAGNIALVCTKNFTKRVSVILQIFLFYNSL